MSVRSILAGLTLAAAILLLVPATSEAASGPVRGSTAEGFWGPAWQAFVSLWGDTGSTSNPDGKTSDGLQPTLPGYVPVPAAPAMIPRTLPPSSAGQAASGSTLRRPGQHTTILRGGAARR